MEQQIKHPSDLNETRTSENAQESSTTLQNDSSAVEDAEIAFHDDDAHEDAPTTPSQLDEDLSLSPGSHTL